MKLVRHPYVVRLHEVQEFLDLHFEYQIIEAGF